MTHVSIKEATAKAIDFAIEALGPERTKGIRLEEVETRTVDGQEAWVITLSMTVSDEELGAIAAVLNPGRREYKTFTALKGNGEVKSMKIREMVTA